MNEELMNKFEELKKEIEHKALIYYSEWLDNQGIEFAVYEEGKESLQVLNDDKIAFVEGFLKGEPSMPDELNPNQPHSSIIPSILNDSACEDKTNTLLQKPIVERTNEEHLWLIKNKFNESVKAYLLSMAEFNENESENTTTTPNSDS